MAGRRHAEVDFDAGTQTRLLISTRRARRRGEQTWQGFSRPSGNGRRAGNAESVRAQIGNSAGPIAPGGGGRGHAADRHRSARSTGGALKVVTTGFREGYLRKNGVPYSENATITEYFHRLPEHRRR